jgi:hypothetical protein
VTSRQQYTLSFWTLGILCQKKEKEKASVSVGFRKTLDILLINFSGVIQLE